MSKSELKTQKNNASVDEFIRSIDNNQRQKDTLEVCKLMRSITGEKPIMWGSSIVGFGTYSYKYASGREGVWMRTGLSPRKAALTIYIMDGFHNYQNLLDKLGPHSKSKSCLYIKKLGDINLEALEAIIRQSYFKGKAFGEI